MCGRKHFLSELLFVFARQADVKKGTHELDGCIGNRAVQRERAADRRFAFGA
jgi:hypothetical protein